MGKFVHLLVVVLAFGATSAPAVAQETAPTEAKAADDFAATLNSLKEVVAAGKSGATVSFAAPMPPMPNLRALQESEDFAETLLKAAMPPGDTISRQDGVVTVRTKNGKVRGLTPSEAASYESYAKSKAAREAGDRALAVRALSNEDRFELRAARDAIAATLPVGARLQEKDGIARVRLSDGSERAPEGAEAEAIAKRDAVAARLEAKVQEARLKQLAPLRIVAEPGLAGRSGSFEKRGVILSQAIVFDRAAVLTGDLSAIDDKANAYTFPAGSKLFVADLPGGAGQAYCLPKQDKPALFKKPAPWIACFLDKDGDGALETQTSGGAPIEGVYGYASGFYEIGKVTQTARFETIPYLDGFQQRIGLAVEYNRFDSKTNSHQLWLYVWAGPDDKSREVVSTTYPELKVGEKKIVEVLGAKVELFSPEKRMVNYRIVAPLPEQSYALKRVFTYTAR